MIQKCPLPYTKISLLIPLLISLLSSACLNTSSGKDADFGNIGPTGGNVLATKPANGDRRVDPNAPIKIDFSKDIDPSALEKSRFSFSDTTAKNYDVNFDIKIDSARSVSLVPTAPLVPGDSYKVIVAGKTVNGVDVQKPNMIDFRVRLALETFTATVEPADHATNVPLYGLIRIEFSEAPDKASVTRETLRIDPPVGGDFEWKDERQLLIRSKYGLPLFERGKTYTIKIEGITTFNKAKELVPISTSFSSAANLLLESINAHPVNGRDTVLGQIGHTNEINLGFDAPIDLKSFQKPGAVVVTATPNNGSNSQNVPGTIKENALYKSVVIFTADQGYPADSKIYITLAATVSDDRGFILGKPLTIRLR